MALEDILVTSWLAPAVITILAAAATAFWTLRANIREKAWLVVYQEKRREIRALISSMDEYASTIIKMREVVALDENEKELKIEAEGLLAVALQHEIDHLDGKLFIDRISRLKRDLYTRRRKKMLRSGIEPPQESSRVMI